MSVAFEGIIFGLAITAAMAATFIYYWRQQIIHGQELEANTSIEVTPAGHNATSRRVPEYYPDGAEWGRNIRMFNFAVQPAQQSIAHLVEIASGTHLVEIASGDGDSDNRVPHLVFRLQLDLLQPTVVTQGEIVEPVQATD